VDKGQGAPPQQVFGGPDPDQQVSPLVRQASVVVVTVVVVTVVVVVVVVVVVGLLEQTPEIQLSPVSQKPLYSPSWVSPQGRPFPMLKLIQKLSLELVGWTQ